MQTRNWHPEYFHLLNVAVPHFDWSAFFGGGGGSGGGDGGCDEMTAPPPSLPPSLIGLSPSVRMLLPLLLMLHSASFRHVIHNRDMLQEAARE